PGAAGARPPLAAAEYRRAGRPRTLDRGEHVLELSLVDDRAEVVLVAGTDALRLGACEEQVAEAVVDGREDDQARARRASLARVRERRQCRRLHGLLQIRVVADDERLLAAELEADLGEPLAGHARDHPPDRS